MLGRPFGAEHGARTNAVSPEATNTHLGHCMRGYVLDKADDIIDEPAGTGRLTRHKEAAHQSLEDEADDQGKAESF